MLLSKSMGVSLFFYQGKKIILAIEIWQMGKKSEGLHNLHVKKTVLDFFLRHVLMSLYISK
jgi:hypothetical protein